MSNSQIPATGQALGEAMMAVRAAAQNLDQAYLGLGVAVEATIPDAQAADKDFQILGLGDILEKLHGNSGNYPRSLALHIKLDKMRRALGWSKPDAIQTRGPGGGGGR